MRRSHHASRPPSRRPNCGSTGPSPSLTASLRPSDSATLSARGSASSMQLRAVVTYCQVRIGSTACHRGSCPPRSATRSRTPPGRLAQSVLAADVDSGPSDVENGEVVDEDDLLRREGGLVVLHSVLGARPADAEAGRRAPAVAVVVEQTGCRAERRRVMTDHVRHAHVAGWQPRTLSSGCPRYGRASPREHADGVRRPATRQPIRTAPTGAVDLLGRHRPAASAWRRRMRPCCLAMMAATLGLHDRRDSSREHCPARRRVRVCEIPVRGPAPVDDLLAARDM